MGGVSEVNQPMVIPSSGEVVIVDSPKKGKLHLFNKPDVFEKQNLPSASQLAFAGITTRLALPKINSISTKLPEAVENGVKQVCKDFGKEFNGMPKNFNPILKYLALIGGTLSVFGLMLKDSNNDGSLDVVEGVKRFLIPNGEECTPEFCFEQ